MDTEKFLNFIKNVHSGKAAAAQEDLQGMVADRLSEKFEHKKAEIASNFFQQPISEEFTGRNIIDGLKKIVDTKRPLIIATDNGDEINVDVDSAVKLVNYFNLHGEKEQFALQRKMRRSAYEFLNVAAGCGANLSTVDYAAGKI